MRPRCTSGRGRTSRASRARAARRRRFAGAVPLPAAHGLSRADRASPAAFRSTSTTGRRSRSTSARDATRKTTAPATSSSCAPRRASCSSPTAPHRGGGRRRRATVAAGEPLYDFTAADGVRHTIWRAGREATDALVAAFEPIPALYIADGHHRAASAARARAELRGASGGRRRGRRGYVHRGGVS